MPSQTSNILNYLPKLINTIPIIVPISLMFNSIMNASLRGFFYTFGTILTLLFNTILSKCIDDGFKNSMLGVGGGGGGGSTSVVNSGDMESKDTVNSGDKESKVADQVDSINHVDCAEGLFGLFDNNSFPDPIATFMAFTTSYVAISPIFINPYINKIGKGFWALTQLSFLTLLIALIRVKACCSSWVSIFCGWFMGLIIGFVWYSTVGYLSKYKAGFTYFENNNRKKCKIDGNLYTCSND